MERTMPTLRAIAPEETDRVRRAYRAWNDPYLLPWDEAVERAARRGLFFVLEEGEELVAASGVFELGGAYVESGGTYVAPAWRGFGLQRLFFRVRAASAVLEVGSEVVFTTAIDWRNRRSQQNAVGFEDMPPLPAHLDPCAFCHKAEDARRAGRACCCDFYALPRDEMRTQIAELLKETVRGDDRAREIDVVRPASGGGRSQSGEGDAGAAKRRLRLECRAVAGLAERRALEAFAASGRLP